MPGMHLRQHGFTYSACEPLAKNKEGIQKLEGTRDSRYIHRDELGKACVEHYMTYRDFNDLTWRTSSVNYYVIKHLLLWKF